MWTKVVGVKRYTDRLGNARAYYRRKGAPAIPINPKLTGAALQREVDRLDRKYLAPKAVAGTLRSLTGEYKTHSDHWRGLRARTRLDYEGVFNWLGGSLDSPLVDFTAPEVSKIRDKARDERQPKFANQVITTLKAVFRYGVEKGFIGANPALGLARATRAAGDDDAPVQSRGNRPCTPAEVVTLLDHAPARLLPAIACAVFATLREGDVVALSKFAIKDGWLTTLQSKSRRANVPARPVTIFICPTFQAIIDGIEANNATTLCVKSDGTPWTLEGFKTAWSRFRDDLLEKKLIGPGVTFHGLRHTGPTILEDAGFEEAQTRHQLGHGPRSISGHYGMTAERKSLLREMALTIEATITRARGNVVPIGNKSV